MRYDELSYLDKIDAICKEKNYMWRIEKFDLIKVSVCKRGMLVGGEEIVKAWATATELLEALKLAFEQLEGKKN